MRCDIAENRDDEPRAGAFFKNTPPFLPFDHYFQFIIMVFVVHETVFHA